MGALLRGRLGCFVILFVILVGIALIGLSLGFSLEEIDVWMEDSGWLEAAVDIGMRIFCGLIFLICLFVFGYGVVARLAPAEWKMDDAPGCIGMGLAALIGYFTAFAAFH